MRVSGESRGGKQLSLCVRVPCLDQDHRARAFRKPKWPSAAPGAEPGLGVRGSGEQAPESSPEAWEEGSGAGRG